MEKFNDIFQSWCRDASAARLRDEAKSFQRKLTEDCSETRFVLREVSCGPNTAEAVLRALRTKNSTRVVDLYGNHIKDAGVEHVMKLIRRNKHIKTLNIGANDITPSGVLLIRDEIQTNESLLSLSLGSELASLHTNHVDSKAAALLFEALIKNGTLTSLNLNRNEIGVNGLVGCEALRKLLEENHTLTRLMLGNNGLEDEGVVPILEPLCSERASLEHLELQNNDLGADSGALLGEVLCRNRRLRTMLLHSNTLGPQGHVFIGESLALNSSLVYLNLSKTNMRDVGLQAVMQGLRRNRTLTFLNISDNSITPIGVRAVAETLMLPSCVLSHIIMSRNLVQDEGALMLAEACNANQSLHELDLNSCKIANEGAMALGYSLLTNKNVRIIRLRDNFLSEAKILLALFERNTTILKIDVAGNQLDHTFLERVKKIGKKNKEKLALKEPIRLEKEVIRLRYQKEKLTHAENDLREKIRKREALQELVNETRENIQLMQQEEKERRVEFEQHVKDQSDKLAQLEDKILLKEEEFDKVREEFEGKFSELQGQIDQELNEKTQLENEFNDKTNKLKDLKDNGPARVQEMKEKIAKVRESTVKFYQRAEELQARMRAYREQERLRALTADAGDGNMAGM